jgi:hypothetical protein
MSHPQNLTGARLSWLDLYYFCESRGLELEPQSELEVAGQLPGRVTGNCPEKRISNS